MKDNLYEIIQEMSVEEKVGSLLTLGFAGTLPRKHIYDYIRKYHCGGLRLSPVFRRFGNYVDPVTHETIVEVESNESLKDLPSAYLNAQEYKEVLDALQKIALSRPHAIPLHFSYDQEGGTSADFNFGGVHLFPKPMGIRASNNPEYAYQVAKASAQQGLSVGFNFMHSPVLDINTEPQNPEIYTRAYSDNVEDVITYARQACKGLFDAGMIATGKHFPGRGQSKVDAHYQVPIINVDKETLIHRELLPYETLIREGLLPSIMIAHSIYPALDSDHIATVSKKIVTDLLRNEMGYEGVITTDSMTMGALATRYGVANACAMALEAGCDLVLMKAENHLVEETIQTILSFIDSGRIPLSELNNKVMRVLKMKQTYQIGQSKQGGLPNEILMKETLKKLSEKVALSAILPLNDKVKKRLPLDKEQEILIIEQVNKNLPNDKYWHPAQLYHECLKHGANVSYYEIDYVISKNDSETLMKEVNKYPIVIITNFYVRSKSANNNFIDKLNDIYHGELFVISNTPYRHSIPLSENNLIISLATTPESISAIAKVLFENLEPTGIWPLKTIKEGHYE